LTTDRTLWYNVYINTNNGGEAIEEEIIIM